MTLEPAGAKAAEALAATHARSFEAPWDASAIAELIDSPGGFALAASEAGAIRAFVLARAIAGEAEILTLAVDPDHRRRGLARALLEAGVAAAQAAGARTMFLEVAADNHAAIGLYEGAEFVRVGARRGYYLRPDGAIDALVMRRDLNSPAG